MERSSKKFRHPEGWWLLCGLHLVVLGVSGVRGKQASLVPGVCSDISSASPGQLRRSHAERLAHKLGEWILREVVVMHGLHPHLRRKRGLPARWTRPWRTARPWHTARRVCVVRGVASSGRWQCGCRRVGSRAEEDLVLPLEGQVGHLNLPWWRLLEQVGAKLLVAPHGAFVLEPSYGECRREDTARHHRKWPIVFESCVDAARRK